MTWLLAISLNCCSAELFMRLPMARLARQMMRRGGRAARVMRSPDISEHWKELVMPAYTVRMARLTFALSAGFAVALAPMIALDRLDPDVGSVLMSPSGLVASCVCALFYVAARRRLVGA